MRKRRHQNPDGKRDLVVQPKMVVGPADDRFEREADRVAKRVVADVAAGATVGAATAQRQGMEDEELLQGKRDQLVVRRQGMEDEELLQGKRDQLVVRRAVSHAPIGPNGGAVADDTASRIDTARGGGRPLPVEVQRSMESAFGNDFSSVRLHEGSASDRLNRELGARAFTTGADIFVAPGELSRGRAGTELLAHELTHVVQQGAAPTLGD